MSSESIGPLAHRLAEALRRHRETHNQSLGDLSRETGLSKTSLMRLERGEGNPSLETLWRLGGALGLTIGQLVEAHAPAPTRVLRAGDGPVVESSTGMRGRLLLNAPANLRTEVFELVLPPDARFQGEPHDPGSRECVHCVEGTIICGPDDDLLELAPGDTAYFDGSLAHSYAGGPEGGRAMLVMGYPPVR
jgi:XRE family transcriptional regulator, regulator of sulfur utilization